MFVSGITIFMDMSNVDGTCIMHWSELNACEVIAMVNVSTRSPHSLYLSSCMTQIYSRHHAILRHLPLLYRDILILYEARSRGYEPALCMEDLWKSILCTAMALFVYLP